MRNGVEEAALETEVEQLRERIAALEEERRIWLRAADEATRQNAATAQALRESEERFSVLTHNLECAVALVDEHGSFRFVNNAFLRVFEIPEGGDVLDVNSRDWAAWQVFDERGCLLSVDEHPVRKAALTQTAVKNELVAVKSPAGSNLKWLLVSAEPILSAEGRLQRLICTYYEITERKATEEALRESESQFRTLANAIPHLCWMSNAEGATVWYNQRWYDYTGAKPEEVAGWGWQAVHHPDSLPAVVERWRASIESGEPFDMVFPLRGADGRFRPFLTRVMPVRDRDGKVTRWFGTSTDISAQRNAEEALAASEKLYRAIGESIDYGIWICDPEGRNTYASESFLKLVGMTQEQCSNFGWGQVLHPDDAERTIKAWQECVRTEGRWDIEHRFRGVDGEWRPILARGVPVRDEHGRIACWAGINLDISALKKAEAEKLQAVAVLEAFFEASPGILNVEDEEFRYLNTDRLTPTYFGLTRESIVGRSVAELAPDFMREFGPMMREVIETGRPRLNAEVHSPVPGRNGETAHWLASYFPVPLPEGRRGIGIMGVDITETKRAEERLRHRQRLESIGALAGGVAHDFNNLLVVIKGNSEEVLEELNPNDPLARLILEIQEASERAAGLTRQLLAFSGQRAGRLEALDLSTIVVDLRKMFRRLVTETIDIKTNLGAIWKARVDRTQMEQLLMNLVVNARDAMPNGGVLTIETSNREMTEEEGLTGSGLKPGKYVCLTVSDTGIGMTAETRARIFEPFFTTKGPGAGTGLGLSTVYGIVQHHGGEIEVATEVNRGSTFRIYLPSADGTVEPEERRPRRPSAYAGEGTVLVVEDDVITLAVAVRMLQRLGYEVLPASNGTEAVSRSGAYRGRIDLLLTDFVMPGLNGAEVARRLSGERPGMRVLFMSGYPNRSGTESLEPGTKFLQKPFGIDDLGHAVREALGGPAES